VKLSYNISTKPDSQNRHEILICYKYKFAGKVITARAKTNIFVSSDPIPLTDVQKKEYNSRNTTWKNFVCYDAILADDIFKGRKLVPETEKALKEHHISAKTKLAELKLALETAEKIAYRGDIEWFKLTVDQFNFPEKYAPKVEVIETPTVLKFIADFIATAHTRKDKQTGRTLAYNNIQTYKATEKHLKEFAKGIGKTDFEFLELDQDFYNGFVEYLQSEITEETKKGETIIIKKSFTQNAVGKHIRVFKLMMNEAQARGICHLPNLKNVFYVFSEETDTIYLNEDELQQIKDKDFSGIPHLDRVRDWFLLLAWTGCRFSDLSKITKTDIKNGFITFRQQKTNNKVTIPLHPVVTEILEKYNYDLPTEISNQRFNEYIKTVCKIAELDSNETMTRTVGGKLTVETFEKHQLVSSHTGRRSFCTNMYKRGLPTLMIMSVSGHKTEKAFLKYIKVKQEEHAEMMASKWAEMYGTNKITTKKQKSKKKS